MARREEDEWEAEENPRWTHKEVAAVFESEGSACIITKRRGRWVERQARVQLLPKMKGRW